MRDRMPGGTLSPYLPTGKNLVLVQVPFAVTHIIYSVLGLYFSI